MGKSAERMTKPIPPLRDGDRMNTREFMRRYEAMPEGFRAELLDGVVYVNRWFETTEEGVRVLMPPISSEGHSKEQFEFSQIMGIYCFSTPGVCGSGPTTLALSDPKSSPEPDGVYYLEPELGGRVYIGPKGYLHGPPELVLEISKTSAGRDLGVKYDQYEQFGVQEYVVWRTQIQEIDWFRRNRAGRFVPIEPRKDGVLCSQVFPGLWIDPVALIARHISRVKEAILLGLASPEHAAFVAKLQAKAKRK